MIKIGLIGYGDRLHEQLELLVQLSCFDVSAIMLTTPAPTYINYDSALLVQSFEELNSRSDAIFLFSSKEYGIDELVEMIKLCSAIYIKKTGHLTISELKRLEEIAYESRSKIQVGNYMLYRPLCIDLISQSESPRLVDARISYPLNSDPRFRVSLNELLYTEIAFLLKLVGAAPMKIRATGVTIAQLNYIDTLSVRIDMNNGATINIHGSILPNESVKTIKVYQPNKIITADLIGNTLSFDFPTKEQHSYSDSYTARQREYEAFYELYCGTISNTLTLADDIQTWETINKIIERISHSVPEC